MTQWRRSLKTTVEFSKFRLIGSPVHSCCLTVSESTNCYLYYMSSHTSLSRIWSMRLASSFICLCIAILIWGISTAWLASSTWTNVEMFESTSRWRYKQINEDFQFIRWLEQDSLTLLLKWIHISASNFQHFLLKRSMCINMISCLTLHKHVIFSFYNTA